MIDKINFYTLGKGLFALNFLYHAKGLFTRTAFRATAGGHNIEPKIIERRYINGIKNLFDIYLPIVDGALIFDNSEGKHELLADKQIDGLLNIVNQEKHHLLKSYYDNN